MLVPKPEQRAPTREVWEMLGKKGDADMNEKTAVVCRETKGAMWAMCPVCRGGKVLKLGAETRAQCLTVYCRRCKHESVVDVVAGSTGPYVTLTAARRPQGWARKYSS